MQSFVLMRLAMSCVENIALILANCSNSVNSVAHHWTDEQRTLKESFNKLLYVFETEMPAVPHAYRKAVGCKLWPASNSNYHE